MDFRNLFASASASLALALALFSGPSFLPAPTEPSYDHTTEIIQLADAAYARHAKGGGSTSVAGSIYWPNGIVNAASGSYTDVNTAITAAVDGQQVVIPCSGTTYTWTTGITTTKQILVRAATLNSTYQGRLTQCVTILNSVNGTSTPLLEFTTGNSYHVGMAGISCAMTISNSATANACLRFNGTGTMIPLAWDNQFQTNQQNASETDDQIVVFLSTGGVLWNNYFIPYPSGTYGDTVGPTVGCVQVNKPNGSAQASWQTNSTMGTLDVGGTNNVYIEGNTFLNAGVYACPDVDEGGRAVIRYNYYDGAGLDMHGFTSNNLGYHGGRHVEVYNNTFTVSNVNRNLGGKWIWTRMGTIVLYSNTFTNSPNSNFPMKLAMTVGETNSNQGGPPNTYFDSSGKPLTTDTKPVPSQNGYGWNAGADAVDSIYAWSNTYGSQQLNGSGCTTTNTPICIDANWSVNPPQLIEFGTEVMDEYHGLGGGTANLAKPNGPWNGNSGAYAGSSYPHPVIAAGGL